MELGIVGPFGCVPPGRVQHFVRPGSGWIPSLLPLWSQQKQRECITKPTRTLFCCHAFLAFVKCSTNAKLFQKPGGYVIRNVYSGWTQQKKKKRHELLFFLWVLFHLPYIRLSQRVEKTMGARRFIFPELSVWARPKQILQCFLKLSRLMDCSFMLFEGVPICNLI